MKSSKLEILKNIVFFLEQIRLQIWFQQCFISTFVEEIFLSFMQYFDY